MVEADRIQGKGIDAGKKKTHGELAEQWLPARRNLTVKVSGNYRQRLDKQLLPCWGHVRIEKIDVDSVSRWVDWCERERVSPWTIREAFTPMSASFGWALSVRKLDENPLRGLRNLLPTPRGKERNVLEVPK